MNHRYFVWAKLMVFEVVSLKFPLIMKNLLWKFFSLTCTIRGENDVQLTFDDPYICQLSKTDVFTEIVLCQFQIMEQLFLKKFFSGNCTLWGRKMMSLLMTHIYVHFWWLIYMLYEQKGCYLK